MEDRSSDFTFQNECNVNLFNVEKKKLNTLIIPSFKEANKVRVSS